MVDLPLHISQQRYNYIPFYSQLKVGEEGGERWLKVCLSSLILNSIQFWHLAVTIWITYAYY